MAIRRKKICIFLGMLLMALLPALPATAATYYVQPGDSLYLIGQRYGLSPWELQQVNNLSSTVIYPGQALWVPGPGERIHVVKPGDSLYSMGLLYGLPYQDIMAANDIKSHWIYPGQILKIPSPNRDLASRGSSPAYKSEDLELLAWVVYAEAGGEPYAGEVAVAAVVLNRVKDPRFPKTIAGVIFEPDAFTCVNDGQFYLNPDATAYQAAREALRGVDPSGRALFYWNPYLVPPNSWVWTRTIITQIGNHVFAR